MATLIQVRSSKTCCDLKAHSFFLNVFKPTSVIAKIKQLATWWILEKRCLLFQMKHSGWDKERYRMGGIYPNSYTHLKARTLIPKMFKPQTSITPQRNQLVFCLSGFSLWGFLCVWATTASQDFQHLRPELPSVLPCSKSRRLGFWGERCSNYRGYRTASIYPSYGSQMSFICDGNFGSHDALRWGPASFWTRPSKKSIVSAQPEPTVRGW